MHLVKLHHDVAAVLGLALAAKPGPKSVTQDGASQVGAIALSKDRIGNVDPLHDLRVGLVARPIAGSRVYVRRCVRNGIAVETNSNSQYVDADGGAHGSQVLYGSVRLLRRRHATRGTELKLLLQFRLEGGAGFVETEGRNRL